MIWGYPYDFGNLHFTTHVPILPHPQHAPMRFPGVPRRTMVRELLDWVLWTLLAVAVAVFGAKRLELGYCWPRIYIYVYIYTYIYIYTHIRIYIIHTYVHNTPSLFIGG